MSDWPPAGCLKALLDLGLLDPLLVQILDELVALHPVDERTDVSAVPEEGAARQVDGTSCVWRGRGEGGGKEAGCEASALLTFDEREVALRTSSNVDKMLMDIWKVERYR